MKRLLWPLAVVVVAAILGGAGLLSAHAWAYLWASTSR